MSIYFKITDTLLDEIQQDLSRRHPFAFERVGFIACRVGKVESDGSWVMLASKYHPVEDDHYVEDYTAGATIGSGAIRKMMQLAYDEPVSIVHVHEHPHRGVPGLSYTDDREMNQLIPNFWHVRPNLPHATVVLSKDSMCGFAWEPSSKQRLPIEDFTVVGAPMRFVRREQRYE